MLVTHSSGHSVQAFVDGVGKDADYISQSIGPCNLTDALSPELEACTNNL